MPPSQTSQPPHLDAQVVAGRRRVVTQPRQAPSPVTFGLSIGFLLALLGLTRAALVFYSKESDAALHPAEPIPADEVGSPPDWQSPLWDTVLATARRERSRIELRCNVGQSPLCSTLVFIFFRVRQFAALVDLAVVRYCRTPWRECPQGLRRVWSCCQLTGVIDENVDVRPRVGVRCDHRSCRVVLDNDASRLSFVSTKAGSVAEVHRFTSLRGGIDRRGNVAVAIFLQSVDTLIPIRDERMRELLFETATFPAANLTAVIDPAVVAALTPGTVQQVKINAELSIHGQVVPVVVDLVAANVGDNRCWSRAASPSSSTQRNSGLRTASSVCVQSRNCRASALPCRSRSCCSSRSGSSSAAALPDKRRLSEPHPELGHQRAARIGWKAQYSSLPILSRPSDAVNFSLS